jgi:predicted CoA-binding protein
MQRPDEPAAIEEMLGVKRLAIVGLSDSEDRPSYGVAQYLQAHGKTIVPVNPTVESVLGEAAYPDLGSIPDPPEVAIVFRRAPACPDIVRQAIEAGIPGIWLQQGIRSDQARELAEANGLRYVEDRCYKIELMTARH